MAISLLLNWGQQSGGKRIGCISDNGALYRHDSTSSNRTPKPKKHSFVRGANKQNVHPWFCGNWFGMFLYCVTNVGSATDGTLVSQFNGLGQPWGV